MGVDMARPDLPESERRIESLTVNLLECYEELDLIYRLSRGLRSTLDRQASAELVLAEAIEIFEGDMGCMIPADAASPAFTHLVSGTEPEVVERLRLAAVQELIRTGRSRIVNSVAEELGLEDPCLPQALLVAPLRTEGAVHGALCVGRRGPETMFTARDLKLAEVLASQAALAIEHLLLQERWRDEEAAAIRVEQEIQLAREIQLNLLPRTAPSLPGYDLAARGVPALSVGGDYYDFLPIGPDRLAICLADVTGHGIPAAMLMANVQATIRSQVLSTGSPAECARRANRLLYQSTDAGRFATCFLGMLDLGTGRLTYANAGHDHPLLAHDSTVESGLDRGGLVLGFLEDAAYEEGGVTLQPGDVLLLYSDGITDAVNGDDEPFGLERLSRILARHRESPADVLVDAVLRETDAHANGRASLDDRTLVVVRRL